MTLKQRIFVDAYMGNGGNATSAARTAGYKGDDMALANMGNQNLGNPATIKAIKAKTVALEEDLGIAQADEVLRRMTRVARGSITQTLDANNQPSLEAAIANGADGLIKSFSRTMTKHGEHVTIKMYDALAAIAQLGKYHGLFADRVIHETQTAGFVQRIGDIIRAGAALLIPDQEARSAFIEYIDTRLAASA